MTDRQTRKVKIRVAKAERSRTNNLIATSRPIHVDVAVEMGNVDAVQRSTAAIHEESRQKSRDRPKRKKTQRVLGLY